MVAVLSWDGADQDSQTGKLLGLDVAQWSDNITFHIFCRHCYAHVEISSECQDVEDKSDTSMSC